DERQYRRAQPWAQRKKYTPPRPSEQRTHGGKPKQGSRQARCRELGSRRGQTRQEPEGNPKTVHGATPRASDAQTFAQASTKRRCSGCATTRTRLGKPNDVQSRTATPSRSNAAVTSVALTFGLPATSTVK